MATQKEPGTEGVATEAPRRARASSGVVTVVGLVVVFFVCARWWYGVNLFDDTAYLAEGQSFALGRFVDAYGAPVLNDLWLFCLKALVRDPLWRYVAAWGVEVAVLASMPLWFRLPGAWLYAFLLLCLPIVCIVPAISLFAAVFVLAGVAWVLRKGLSVCDAACVACGVSLVVAFVRPEYAYGVFIAAAVALVAVCVDASRGGRRAVAWKLAGLGVCVVAMAWPMRQSPARRSGPAFAEHVFIRAGERGLRGPADDVMTYAAKLYGLAPRLHPADAPLGLGDYFHADPRRFVRHLAENLLDARTLGLLLACGVLVALPWCVRAYRPLRAASVYVLLLGVPAFASFVVIYPRAHYAVTFLPAALLLVVQIVVAHRLSAPPVWAVLAVGAAVMLPEARAYRHDHIPDITFNLRPSLQAVRCLRDVEREQGLGNRVVFGLGWVFYDQVYLRQPAEIVGQAGATEWPVFEAWLAERRPAVVMVSERMAYVYRRSPEAIGAALEGDGYRVRACPRGSGETVYVRR